MSEKDGGPAFPIGSTPEDWGNGMTLLDWFAGQELAKVTSVGSHSTSYDVVAEHCYRQARAMLKARET